MYFDVVTSACRRIEQETSRTIITTILADLFKQANADEAQFLAYFCLGKLYPAHENKNLNLATKSVVKAVANLLARDSKEVAAEVKELGDVGIYTQKALLEMRGRIVDQPTDLTVMQVCDELHAIVEVTGSGSQEAKEQRLISLLQKLLLKRHAILFAVS